MMYADEFVKYCKHQHDVVCNQKYDNGKHPYSFHLEMVVKQAELFEHLIFCDDPYYSNTMMGCWGHDLIGDARVTYNDLVQMVGKEVANIIYCCTEEKGRNRYDRHNQKYFDELKQNKDAVFVKLCDVIANVKYSLLTNSSMYDKYKKEFVKMKKELYTEQYKEMFDYLEKLLSI